MNQDVPPLPYLLNIEGGRGGGEALNADKGEDGGRELTATNLGIAGGDWGDPDPPSPPINIDLGMIGMIVWYLTAIFRRDAALVTGGGNMQCS